MSLTPFPKAMECSSQTWDLSYNYTSMFPSTINSPPPLLEKSMFPSTINSPPLLFENSVPSNNTLARLGCSNAEAINVVPRFRRRGRKEYRNPESDDYYGGGDGGDHDDGPGDDGHNGDNDKQNSEFNYSSSFFHGGDGKDGDDTNDDKECIPIVHQYAPGKRQILSRCILAWEKRTTKPFLLAFAMLFVYLLHRIAYGMVLRVRFPGLCVVDLWNNCEIIIVTVMAVVIFVLWFCSSSFGFFFLSLLILLSICICTDQLLK
ncbi:uncharacterized protein LOC127182869 isoform X3 [Labeo rohita]|uniref:uncharacterized protein LOC127182869 isoform X2 n=1 Tax=Labeo rohita TaxID=84645 RepID=UPI0021E2974E|nr:uncharacterized protein LOC127182869 isoform X2 [Labeo rohita]XP_050994497.1 uncharacterized protein LOC127182869 isoform X3 [Labeo rohita]